MTTAIDLPYEKITMPEAGTPEWLELRRTHGIGASEIAAVLGMSKWATPLDVYLDKRGITAPDPSNRAMRRGNAMEPFIHSEFELETGFTGTKPDYMCKSIKHTHLFANLDWLSKCGTFGGEFKSSEDSRAWGESGSEDVPLYYYMQVQQQLGVTGLDLIYLAAMLPYSDLRIYPITPEPLIWNRIVERSEKFWNDTLNGIEPEGDASPEAVKKLFPVVSEGKEIEINDQEACTLVARHETLRDEIKAAEEAKKQIEARLLMLVGDAKKATIPMWSGSITRSETKETVVPSFTRKAGITMRINHPKSKG